MQERTPPSVGGSPGKPSELYRRLTIGLPVILLVLFGGFVLLISAAEEPYHIDELRQVRSYDRDLAGVIQASVQQEQPPLDAVLNSFAQDLLGIGDVRQRLLSVGFGVGSLALVAVLTLRSGFLALGSVSTLGVMSLTPALISVTAYARPYALPVFLMMAFLALAHIWLDRGRPWALILAFLVAGLLPWSRTVEPVIFLVCSAMIMSILALARQRRRPAIWMLVASCFGLVSSIPAIGLLLDQLGDRTASDGSLPERLARLGSDIPTAIGTAFPYWPFLVLIVLLAVVRPAARRLLARLWWWWVLVGTAIGFVLAFVAIAPVTQGFFGRYLFTWVIPFSILVGAVVSSATEVSRRLVVPAGVTFGAVGLLIAWAGYLTWHDLSTKSTSDWKAVSAVITEDLPADTAVLYDQLRRLGAYRTPYAGYPRYTKGQPRIPLSLNVIRDPSTFSPGSNTAVILLTGGTRFDVPGWIGIGIDRYFTVYLPSSPRPGLAGAAGAAEEFAEALGPDLGAAMQLTAASLWSKSGDSERADILVEELLAQDDLRDTVLATIEGTELQDS